MVIASDAPLAHAASSISRPSEPKTLSVRLDQSSGIASPNYDLRRLLPARQKVFKAVSVHGAPLVGGAVFPIFVVERWRTQTSL